MDIKIGRIVGRMEGGVWGQIFERDGLIALVSAETETISAGREVISRLNELYFGTEVRGLAVLKNAVTEMIKEFEGLQIVAMLLIGDFLEIVAVGGGVWTKKQDREGWIIPQGSEQQVVTMGGKVDPGQIIVAGDKAFWNELTLGSVKAAVEDAEMLGTMLRGGQKVGGVGIILRMQNKSQILNPKIQNLSSKIQGLGFRIHWPKINWPTKGTIYLTENKERSKKKTMWLGVVFLIILVGVIVMGQMRRSQIAKKTSEYAQRMDAVKYKFEEAKALAGLNPTRSRDLLTEVDKEVASLSGFSQSKKDKDLAYIKSGFGEVLGVATGIKKTAGELVVDLALVRDGMTGTKIALGDNKLWVLDVAGSRLVSVDPAKKSAKVITGKETLGESKTMTVYPGVVTILGEKGIVECSVTGNQCPVKVKFDEGWGQVIDMGMFAGNIYVVSDSGVWRQQKMDSGYGTRQAWLASTEKTDVLTGVQNMAIDGFIWMIKDDGQILKYVRGVKENIGISGLDLAFGKRLNIYTNDEDEKLYVLDSDNKRVVVLKKTGEYESQYLWEGMADSTGLVVDEKSGKIYLVGGSKIWSVSL